MSLPLIVLEGTGDVELEALLVDATAELASLGWSVHGSVDDARAARAGVWSTSVSDADDAARAVLAAVDGVGLLVRATADQEVVDRLCDDLRRLGHLEHRIGAGAPLLTIDERELLDRLSDGVTLGTAAAQLHLSRRTADRRLASARAALGADTTAQAIALHRRRLERLPRPTDRPD